MYISIYTKKVDIYIYIYVYVNTCVLVSVYDTTIYNIKFHQDMLYMSQKHMLIKHANIYKKKQTIELYKTYYVKWFINLNSHQIVENRMYTLEL